MALGVLLMLLSFSLSLVSRWLVAVSEGHGSSMNDLNLMDEPVQIDQSMREEIRRVSHASRARRLLISRVMVTLCALTLCATAVPLVLLLFQLIKRGAPELSWTFFTKVPETPTLIAPNATGGLSNAIIGSIALNIYAAILAIPVGVLVGVYLAESLSKFASAVRIIAQTMAGAPSILMGLFAFSFMFQDLHIGFSAIDGSFALAVLMLPVIIIATEIAVLNVPNTLREAGLALRGQTSQSVDARGDSFSAHRYRHGLHSRDLTSHWRNGAGTARYWRRLLKFVQAAKPRVGVALVDL